MRCCLFCYQCFQKVVQVWWLFVKYSIIFWTLPLNCNIWWPLSYFAEQLILTCSGNWIKSAKITNYTMFAIAPLITSIWVVTLIRLYYQSFDYLALEISYITWAASMFIYNMIKNVHPWIKYPTTNGLDNDEREKWYKKILYHSLLRFGIKTKGWSWESSHYIAASLSVFPAFIVGYFIYYFMDTNYTLSCDEQFDSNSGNVIIDNIYIDGNQVTCIVQSSLTHFDFYAFFSSLGGSVFSAWLAVQICVNSIIENSDDIVYIKTETQVLKDILDEIQNQLGEFNQNGQSRNTADASP